MSKTEQAVSLGYSEGFDTGRTFAANNLSRVGFLQQLIEDKLSAHISNNEIDPSKADYYRTWFTNGVTDAEALVAQAMSAEKAPASDDGSSSSGGSPGSSDSGSN
jgi:hypothetical protein